MPAIGLFLVWNIVTAVDSCGTYPTNQAALFFSVVPVLPATCRPGSAARVPVPPVTTERSAYVACAACSRLSAGSAFFSHGRLRIDLPCELVIWVRRCGMPGVPPWARAAWPDAW